MTLSQTLPPVYILRHGETIWNREGRMQGNLHSDLSDTGRAQARAQARLMQPILNTTQDLAVYCSPQERAKQTLEIVLGGRVPQQVIFDPRLAEVGMGVWQGLILDEITARWPTCRSAPSRFEMSMIAPGGEGFAALYLRIAAFVKDLCCPAMVVTHGITSCMLRGHLLGLERGEIGKLDYAQGVVFAIQNGQETVIAPELLRSSIVPTP